MPFSKFQEVEEIFSSEGIYKIYVRELQEKQDEIKTMQRNIKRAMIEDEFDDPNLRKIVIERFMELARVKFK